MRSSTKKYRITPKAGHDLVLIGRYTQQTWGQKSRTAYLLRIRRRIEWLAEHPHLGTRHAEVGQGFLSYPEGEHLVFYLIYPERIDIIGIPIGGWISRPI